GSIAGICVDGVLFPLDAIKTRLQSSKGFYKSGGFKSIYKGITPALLGSAPGAALFFCTYTIVKGHAPNSLPQPITQMSGAALGEVVACLVRVPVEVIKQRAMVSSSKSPLTLSRLTYQNEGWRGFYRGYMSTVLREIPFSIVQFPIWEYLKVTWGRNQDSQVLPWQSAVCGAIAGCGIAAATTTPLDVAKTRIMLAKHTSDLSRGNVITAIQHVYRHKGINGLFDGIVPRVMWISLGGAIFLGVYDQVVYLIK
ncbi:hypothetical protein HELRODRAFT_79715, partial [Helobdella robusta]|uniref:S-adenosylmethionine mitochondrial carrier protein n=1 Tax=Helobdella robusta TaxID=6412 RepID=T1G3S6_HELRO